MTRYLSPQDAAFLRMESRRTPMHVGALLVFQLPDDAPPDFLRELLRQMRENPFMPAPFDCKLSQSTVGKILPHWVPADSDMDYHVRHIALPYPGSERELGAQVARLHSRPMDLTRPVWEGTLIEGLENRRFAFYFKAHHCAIDGMGAMNMVRQWLSEDPDDKSGPGMPKSRVSPENEAEREHDTLLRKVLKNARGNAAAVRELIKTLVQLGRGGKESVLRAAATTPRTLFNVPVSQQRRLGTQLLELARFKAITDATGATVNDVALAVCSGAVRRYLLERDALPGPSLTASVPMGLPRSDGKPGNAVTGFVCPLATDIEDPLARLERIATVTARTKKQMLAMSSTALEQVALLGMSPLILGQMTGLLPRLPPFFNFVVSNVVASKKPLYLRGARMDAMYPVSFLFDGYAINLTLVGYCDKVAIGFIGCRDAIPHLQRLAVYTGDALSELEDAVKAAGPRPMKKKSAKREAAAAS